MAAGEILRQMHKGGHGGAVSGFPDIMTEGREVRNAAVALFVLEDDIMSVFFFFGAKRQNK